jgi:hypothetical protein
MSKLNGRAKDRFRLFIGEHLAIKDTDRKGMMETVRNMRGMRVIVKRVPDMSLDAAASKTVVKPKLHDKKD